MGSSAQNNSGVHWCRRRVRFNEVPEKVPKVPEKVWEALVQSQVRFNRVPEKVPVKVWEALVQSQVRFNRVPAKVLVKGWEGSEGSGEGLGGFGVARWGWTGFQRRFRWRSERLSCRARSGSTAFRRRFWRRLWCSQVRFNRVPEMVPALGFAARFRKICKKKKLRLLGIPPKLIAFPCFSATTPRARYMFTKRLTPE